MKDTETVIQSRVRCARIDKVARSQLLDSTEFLKNRRIDNTHKSVGEVDVFPERIAHGSIVIAFNMREYAVMTCHGEQSLPACDSAVKRRLHRLASRGLRGAAFLALFCGLFFAACTPDSAPDDDIGDVVSPDVRQLPEDDDWEPPEPGSDRLRSTTRPDRYSASDPAEAEEVADEFVLHVPRPPGIRGVMASDREIGRLGSRRSGGSESDERDSSAFTVVEEFLDSLRGGAFASDMVHPMRESSVLRRVQPIVDGDASFAGFRVGAPDRSMDGTTVSVRLFSGNDPATSASEIIGDVYLYDDGSIEDVQIDVAALEE